MLGIAYALAEHATSDDHRLKFILFWLGLFLVIVPATLRMCDAVVSRTERYCVIAAVGLFTYVPKFLRNPDRPLFFDELAHWTQSERLFDSGVLQQPNPAVAILKNFPGLHAITVSIRHVTGLSTWYTGVILVALLHVLALIGVYVIARRVSASDRIAGLAALLYAINPAFLFFNAQYAYQTLAIVLVIWAIVAVLEAAEAAPGAARTGWMAVFLVLLTACAISHHLATYVMLFFLVVYAGLVTWWSRRVEGPERPAAETVARVAWLLTGIAVLDVLVLSVLQGGGIDGLRTLYDYLSPYPREGARELASLFTGKRRRTPFGDSGLPVYEQVMSFVAPIVLAFFAFIGWRSGLARHRSAPAFFALGVLGLLYFASLPLVLTRTGSEGAHRTFPYSYLGLAILVALGFGSWLVSAKRRPKFLNRDQVLLVIAGSMIVLFMGNVAGEVNLYYRFPGPVVTGSDTRTDSPELRAATTFFDGVDTDSKVATDLYTGTLYSANALDRNDCAIAAVCPHGYDFYKLFFYPEVADAIVRRLERDGYGYLVVDRRMSEQKPRNGFYFDKYEPLAFRRESPLREEALTKFERMPWANKIYASSHYDVYRIDYGALP